MRKNTNFQPLIIEDHPSDYNGYEFITLIKHGDISYLTIVDNMTDDEIVAYVLDYCPQQDIDEAEIILIANDWFEFKRTLYPLSIEFSKQNRASEMSKIIRRFNVDYVTRVIGPVYQFKMSGPVKIKRRKKKDVPPELKKGKPL